MSRKGALLCAVTVALAGCSSSSGLPQPAVTATPAPQLLRFSHVFSFSGTDGKHPYAALIEINGALFGTTYGGGKYDSGTAFKVSASGGQRVLHSFRGGSDGALPEASLLDVAGALYGTTVNGGGSGEEGTVFKLGRAGRETVLHRFGAHADGANPYAGLIALSGMLYGVTAGGGKYSQGTVFAISTSGTERVLYDFGRSNTDGSTPVAGLTAVDGSLYGTTAYGGTSYDGQNCPDYGCGTAFTIDPSGKLKTLYNFAGGNDGAFPAASLIEVNGTLYGTTTSGGVANDGTVFALTPSGVEQVVYSFKGGADGAGPQGLVNVSGTLYGTTSGGGANNDGTIFAVVATSGVESVLYTFKGGVDGAQPRCGLLDVNGTLYGTTALGGVGQDGTVFKLVP